ncbi:MAG: flagellar assembly peptidoglycan hydrolase FlgJ [Lautropia sp.]
MILPPANDARAPEGLAFDARTLDALRRRAGDDPQGAVREAAGQFEALFMQQLLKSMRAAIPKSGMFEGPGQETYTAMLDEQLAQRMGSLPGGLADVIARQMSRAGGAAAGGAEGGLADAADRPAITPLTPSSAGGLPGNEGSPPSRESVAAGATVTPPGPTLSGRQLAFVEQMWPHAKDAEARSGVPAAFVVGQAALESGWGRRDIRGPQGEPSYNLFGIKATGGWSGRSVPVMTTEYVDGTPRKVVEKFRAYDSYADAFADWARLMAGSDRYAKVLEADTAADFAQRIQQAGYATDPRYADKLQRVIAQAESAAGSLGPAGASPLTGE